MFYTVTSEKSFEQAIADLKLALAEQKFGVLWEMNIPAKSFYSLYTSFK